MKLQITTLIENNPDKEDQLLYEHGLSLYIEADGMKILFDTGQSGNFIQNAKTCHKELKLLDYMIISHGHYDHSGGFMKLVDLLDTYPELIVGDEFFYPKYKKISENKFKYNGNSFDEKYIIEKGIPIKKIKEDIYYLTEKIMIFHGFERNTEFETLNDNFVVQKSEKQEYIPDEFLDEIVLGIETDKGLVVVVGCSHVGVINIMQTIEKRINIPIYAVVGGTHLIEADESRMKKTVSAFREMNIKLIAVSHCTGEAGIKLLQHEFKEKFIFNNTGNIVNLE